MSIRRSGFSSSASASASARIRRPSASVLPISTVMPLRLVSTSPGRKALPAIEFSTAGMSTRSRTLSLRRHDHLGEPQDIGGAAHVLLHQQHAGGRLDVEAAGIETHALADQRHLWRARRPPGKIDEARSPRTATPTAWIIGKLRSSSRPVDHLELGFEPGGDFPRRQSRARPVPDPMPAC